MFGEIRYVTSHYNTSESASKKQIQNPVQGVENKTVLFESCTTYLFWFRRRGDFGRLQLCPGEDAGGWCFRTDPPNILIFEKVVGVLEERLTISGRHSVAGHASLLRQVARETRAGFGGHCSIFGRVLLGGVEGGVQGPDVAGPHGVVPRFL